MQIKFTPILQKRTYIPLSEIVEDKNRNAQIYLSRTLDPFVNLAIEQYLLTHSPPSSTILFLYSNRPSVILGRNQNPWVEVNNGLLKKGHGDIKKVDLVRRRSGGGTVWHDEGNVNYSVIFPPAEFDRDKHALMVVRALQSLGVERAKVNERHDIVMDVRPEKELPKSEDIVEGELPAEVKPKKISGSAYKLTKHRSMHHGTCLLNSKNLSMIGKYLKSPASPYIKGLGTPSVRSKITNVGVANELFEKAVVGEFEKMYGNVEPVEVDEVDVDDVRAIKDELAHIKVSCFAFKLHASELRTISQSPDFIYGMTPRFSFSSIPTEQSPTERPPLPDTINPGAVVQFNTHWGKITEGTVTVTDHGGFRNVGSALVGHKIWEIKDWNDVLPSLGPGEYKAVGDWLNTLFR